MSVAARKMDDTPVRRLPVVDAGHVVFHKVERPASVWAVLKPWHQGLLIIMTIIVVFSALSVVLVQHIYRQQLRAFQVQVDTRDALNRSWNQLLVEQSAWAALDHVETAARTQLHMVIPDLSQVTFLPALPDVLALLKPSSSGDLSALTQEAPQSQLRKSTPQKTTWMTSPLGLSLHQAEESVASRYAEPAAVSESALRDNTTDLVRQRHTIMVHTSRVPET